MKAKFYLALAASALMVGACAKTPKTDSEKASYSIGVQVGTSLERVKGQVKISSVIQGIQDKVAGTTPKLSDADMTAAMSALQQAMQSQQAAPADDASQDKTGYTVGIQIGTSLARYKDSISLDQVFQGMKDQLNGKTLKMTSDDMHTAMVAFQQQADAVQSSKNQKDGEAFLNQNKLNPKVKITKSGLQYEVLVQGKGRKPKATDKVRVNYEGKLVDGTVFDSSYKRGQPAEFMVNGVIPGWTEALQLMPVGSKWHIVLPSAIAYGPRGAGGLIGPDAVLQFDVELLDIVKK